MLDILSGPFGPGLASSTNIEYIGKAEVFFLGTWVKGGKFSVKFAILQYENNKTNA